MEVKLISDLTGAILDKLYLSDALVLEGVNVLEGDLRDLIINELRKYNIFVELSATVYVFTGKEINEHYDLEGDNAYKDDFHISMISLNDVHMSVEDTDFEGFKNNTKWRYWKDVVDNNEYREWLKGRHMMSDRIKWIVDFASSSH